MLIFKTFEMMWPMCLFLFGFFVVLSLITHYLRAPFGGWTVNARGLAWASLVLFFISLSIVTTLIDSPYLDVPQEVIVWLFMISAFVGLPLCVPVGAAALWGLYAALRGERVRLSTLGLLLLGSFSIGAATSNMHDVLWCGIITKWYTVPYPAGGDLAAFFFVAKWFPAPESFYADYAPFGTCMMVMICGELLLAAVSFRRLCRIETAARAERVEAAAQS